MAFTGMSGGPGACKGDPKAVARLVGRKQGTECLQGQEWSAVSVASERAGVLKTKRFSLDLATDVVSVEWQVQKMDHDQLNKWKYRQLCPKAWLWKEGKGEQKGGRGIEGLSMSSLHRCEAVFEQGLKGEAEFRHRKMIGKGVYYR